MYYIVTTAPSRTEQITIADLVDGNFDMNTFSDRSIPYTRTFKSEAMPYALKQKTSVWRMVNALVRVKEIAESHNIDINHMENYYRHFEIKKRGGGKRPIDAPNDELKLCLKEFRRCLENDIGAKWHTSAYAYVPGRSTLDERQYHADRGSRWFEYLDFHNFFGSFTYEFAWETIIQIYPFCMIVEKPKGKEALEYCLKLCFLNGGLPQGTPISPMLTNLLMIPFDFEMSKKLAHSYGDQQFFYTRYADDICISSKQDFEPKSIEHDVLSMLAELGCPFVLNTKKTHYCSFAGHNFHLGLMYNRDKNITVGWEQKDKIKAALTNYALDTRNGKAWSLHDAQVLLGKLNYCRSCEKDYFNYVLEHLGDKFKMDIEATLRAQIKQGGIVV